MTLAGYGLQPERASSWEALPANNPGQATGGFVEKKTYWELLKHPNWQRKRLEVLSRAGFQCEECGSTEETLEVHHTYYEKDRLPWQYPSESLHALCRSCHAQAQDTLTLLKRQLGKYDDVRQIETLYGFALGYEAKRFPDKPLDVYSPFVAMGLALYFEVDYDAVIEAMDDGVIDGAKLDQIFKAECERRRSGRS